MYSTEMLGSKCLARESFRSMIGELAVALASAVEAALALAADAPLFLKADLAASHHQRN